MHLKTTFYWALAIESPKVKGRAALGASSDVEPASWGAVGAVCLSVSRAADFAVREVPCHSVGLKGLPCSPGGFLCATRVPSSASLGPQDFLRENHKGENDITGPRRATCLQRIGLRKTPIKNK